MLYALDGQAPEIDKGAGFVAPDAALIGRVRLAAGASVWKMGSSLSYTAASAPIIML